MKFSDKIKNYTGPNPFSDSQARNYSDSKVIDEFYPISKFWTLFNDQHEILLGTRGSGKTFLLKMMRYSMLKKIQDEKAQSIVRDKEFIAIYVPMHLEFVAIFNDSKFPEDLQATFFQFGFNCKLAEALITELKSIVDDIQDKIQRAKTMVALVEYLDQTWFESERTDIYDFSALSNKISQMYYSMDWENENLVDIPAMFKRQICTPLLSVKSMIKEILNLNHEPTWIVCIDEAEFLNETSQKCINNVFRSDSNRIALKVATLPYYHKTLNTLVPNVYVDDGNDFSFRVVDLAYDSADFVALTNKLCKHRLIKRFDNIKVCPDLETFLGIVGNDDQIDYYRNEVGEEKASMEVVEQSIINSFPPKRKKNACQYSNKRKTIYDKYAPIYFIREMYRLSNIGNHKPGWYAGAKNVRKLAHGNPRIFIQIMNDLFEKAKKSALTAKAQHEVLMKFAKRYCEETQALEKKGPIIYKELDKISSYLRDKVHDGYIRSTGSSFVLKYQSKDNFLEVKEWIELAVAYSRIIVNDEAKICGIKENTKYILSNSYAMAYWLPIRSDSPEKISISQNENNKYVVKTPSKQEWTQLSLFEEVPND